LRRQQDLGRERRHVESSRPPRTGSIAATSPAPTAATANRPSSRPPRTGSIAARDGAGDFDSGRNVVPSAKDGLHCGHIQPPEVRMCQYQSSRPPRTGSIAATARSRGRRSAARVVPSAKDGLHCGTLTCRVLGGTQGVVPSAKDGLHCGCEFGSSVPSIARVVPSAKDGLHCGGWTVTTPDSALARRPVRQGRAPLRHDVLGRASGRRSRSSRPPRTGSIAASPRRCAHSMAIAGRPVRQGRAPLRPDQLRSRAWRRCGRPVRQGRAPLRRPCGPVVPPMWRPVVPSAKDGLHCGSPAAAWNSLSIRSSSRPPRTGSIAAEPGVGHAAAECPSSRPPRTGSIAAT